MLTYISNDLSLMLSHQYTIIWINLYVTFRRVMYVCTGKKKNARKKMSRHSRRYESMKCLVCYFDSFNKCFNLGYGWSRWLLSALPFLFLSLMIDHFHIHIERWSSSKKKRVRKNRCSIRQNKKKFTKRVCTIKKRKEMTNIIN
jgi:hypothetical protein